MKNKKPILNIALSCLISFFLVSCGDDDKDKDKDKDDPNGVSEMNAGEGLPKSRWFGSQVQPVNSLATLKDSTVSLDQASFKLNAKFDPLKNTNLELNFRLLYTKFGSLRIFGANDQQEMGFGHCLIKECTWAINRPGNMWIMKLVFEPQLLEISFNGEISGQKFDHVYRFEPAVER